MPPRRVSLSLLFCRLLRNLCLNWCLEIFVAVDSLRRNSPSLATGYLEGMVEGEELAFV